MRRVDEEKVWGDLKKNRQSEPAEIVSIGEVSFDWSTPCLIVGGRNGAGKSRFLRALRDHLSDPGLLLELHHLCEQALIVLRSRDDFFEMKEEFEALGPDEERRDDLQRIIGREYEAIDWYALEVEPSDERIAELFRWGGEQPLLPYFEARHRGVFYTSRDMGLGEFSVHFLFWILEQYREVEKLTLLLDEPDSYLPPTGASALLARLLRICLKRGWRIVLTTHSSEIIGQGLEEESFVLLYTDDGGAVGAIHCADDPTVADTLLARPPVRHVFLVEDESAWMLTRVLIESMDRGLSRTSSIIWGNGSGYLTELQAHFPRPPRPDIKFAYVFDGDKRGEVSKSARDRWPVLFLPTNRDPDQLFQSARSDIAKLARRLNVPEGQLYRFLESREGVDPHDWVNDLGEEYGRPLVLRALAELWVEDNRSVVDLFVEELRKVL